MPFTGKSITAWLEIKACSLLLLFKKGNSFWSCLYLIHSGQFFQRIF